MVVVDPNLNKGQILKGSSLIVTKKVHFKRDCPNHKSKENETISEIWK